MKNHILRLKPGMSLFACAACALGLLLWARLLLVSSPPRIATAEPPTSPTPTPPAPRCVQPTSEEPEYQDARDYRLGRR